MARTHSRYVRQMPKIYGNLQKPKRDWSGLLRAMKRLALGAGGIALLYALFFGPAFRVRKVEVQGASLINVAELEKAVPRNGSIWFLPHEDIVAEISKQPLITSVSVYRGIPDSVRVAVVEREPVLAWVSGNLLILVDAQGTAFAQYAEGEVPAKGTPPGDKIASLPKVVDTKGLPVVLGSQILSSHFTRFYAEVRSQMAELIPEVSIDRAEIFATTYELTVVTKLGMQVKFSTQGDAGVQVRNLTRLVHQRKVDIRSSKVDLRVDRWAYVS